MKWIGLQEFVKNETDLENVQFKLFAEKNMVAAIEKIKQEKNFDLLVILKEKRGFFSQLFGSSDTKNVLTHFNKPVLVYHEK